MVQLQGQRRLITSKVFPVIFILCHFCHFSEQKSNGKTLSCPEGDNFCEADKVGFDAIKQLHSSIDDDRDGSLDRTESDGFIRDELHYEDGFDRHSSFHGSDDHISVKDLWQIWVHSEVYNWTAEEVIEWLEFHVELPQYSENFRANEVQGKLLPRLAASGQFITSMLGIKNAIDKQKLAVKAQDIVLFGPPKKPHSYVKDLLLVMSLVIAVGGCWLAYMQNKHSQHHLKKVMKDLEQLQSAEDALTQLKSKLNEAHKEKDNYAEEKESLEMQMRDEIQTSKKEAEQLRKIREVTAEEIGRLKLAEQELEQYKRALEKAEIELQQSHHSPPGELQQWLQLTYEMESIHYNTKREAAEKQLLQAKEMYVKLKRKKNHLMGSLQLAHNGHVDITDRAIAKARSALEEVKQDLQERSSRWKQIEKICHFSVVHNPGLDFLESVLRAPTGSIGSISTNNLRELVGPSHSVDEADEDMPPGAFTAQAAFYGRIPSQNKFLGNTYSCMNPNSYNLGLSLPVSKRSPSPRSLISSYQPSRAAFYGRTPSQNNTFLGNTYSSMNPNSYNPTLSLPVPERSPSPRSLTPTYQPSRHNNGTQPFGMIPDFHDRSSSWSATDAFNNRPTTKSRPSVSAFKPIHSANANSISSITVEKGRFSGDDTDSVSTVSGASTSNGPIKFNLGENSSPAETPEDTEKTVPQLGQSQSMEAKSSTVRPRVLKSTRSESALSGLAALKKSSGANGSNHQKNLLKNSLTTTESMSELSSLTESMDSLNEGSEAGINNISLHPKETTSKKKNKLLAKLFKGKQKES